MPSSVKTTKRSLIQATATDDSKARRPSIEQKVVAEVAPDAHICTTDTHLSSKRQDIYTSATATWRFPITYRQLVNLSMTKRFYDEDEIKVASY